MNSNFQSRPTNLIALGIGALLSVTAWAQKPNVVFICVDDMNGYGLVKKYVPMKVPYFDKLSEEAIVFANCCPQSTPHISK